MKDKSTASVSTSLGHNSRLAQRCLSQTMQATGCMSFGKLRHSVCLGYTHRTDAYRELLATGSWGGRGQLRRRGALCAAQRATRANESTVLGLFRRLHRSSRKTRASTHSCAGKLSALGHFEPSQFPIHPLSSWDGSVG
jgi:hypothetical protein